MNYNLNYEGFESYLDHSHVSYLFRFENGYGASVIKNRSSYGYEKDLWELAVIQFNDDGIWDICYTTEITSDVIGYLTDEDVRKLLEKIKAL